MNAFSSSAPAAAIVTGASRGLGLGIARSLAAAGHPVVLAARGRDDLDRAAREIGGAALAVPTDVAVGADVDRLVAIARERFGAIGVVVNNAGAEPVFDPLETMTWERWRRSIDVDVHGTYAVSRAVAPGMIAAGGGTIVNVVGAAGGGLSSPPHLSFSPAQSALASLSRCLASVLEPGGVAVHTLLPALTPAGQIGRTAAPVLGVEFGDEVLGPDQMGDAVVRLLDERRGADWRVGPGGLSLASGAAA